MRVAIVGAGAMGTMFGCYLARAGHDVTLVDVDAAHVGAIRRDGAVLRFPDGRTETVTIDATADPLHDLAPVDAAIVLCKGWANEQAARSIHHAVTATTWVATIQNGLGNDVALARVLPAERVLPGTTTAGAMKNDPGVIEISPITAVGRSLTQLGPPRTASFDAEQVAPLTTALTAAGLPCELLPNADVVIWTKLAMAATAGPLTAALGTTVQGMMDSAAGRQLLQAMFDEIVDLADAIGIRLDRSTVWNHALTTYGAVGPHITSMAADVLARRRSEIDSFCVAISDLGREHGVATPTHDVIGRLIVAREEEQGLR